MTLSEALLPEFDQEMAPTRRLLERVPSEKGEWKPHPKSFSLGHLAQLVATMPGWLVRMCQHPDLDLANSAGYSYEKTQTLLDRFEKGVREGREALAATSDKDFDVPWSLKMGDRVLMTQPRRVVVRQHINHIVHHRGQLTVYLRLLDVPIPSVYGPTADEKW
jgi:uncharacterized damage-inducible protein DinB